MCHAAAAGASETCGVSTCGSLPDRGQARIDQYHVLISQCVGVKRLVRRMKPCRPGWWPEIGCVPVHAVQRHGDFEDLLAVSHVGRSVQRHRRHRTTQAASRPSASISAKAALQGWSMSMLPDWPCVTPGLRLSSTRRSVFSMPQADSTEAASGTATRGDAEFGRHRRDVQSGRATECQQGELPARIDAAADRCHPHAVSHATVDQPMDARRRRAASCDTRAPPRASLRPPSPRPGPGCDGRPGNSPRSR